MKCSICHDQIKNSRIDVKEMMFGSGRTYSYIKCSACGCLQIEKPETNPANLYPVTYYSFNTYNISNIIRRIKQMVLKYSVAASLGRRSVFTFLFAKKDRDYGAHALKGKTAAHMKILDVGCGDGSLIKALNACGYKQLTGIDPYLHADIIGPSYRLLKKNIEELEGNEMYDVIMLHHSFEHVTNPFEIMAHINRLLKKNGLCIIRIPVADSAAFDMYKENWVQIDAPRHIFLHTNKSMENVVAAAGLYIESTADDSTVFQFIGSEQYKKCISLNDPRSYYVPPYRKMFFNKKHPFSSAEINKFSRQAEELNRQGKGDQRIYYIRKKQK